MTNFEELEKLAKLKEQGILSEEEFEIEKRKILGNENGKIHNDKNSEIILNTDSIFLKQKYNGHTVECITGFSWTSLIFGPWVPLLRGDFLWFFLYILLGVITFSIFCFIFPFLYNSMYIKNYLKKGYIPSDIKSEHYLKLNGFIL